MNRVKAVKLLTSVQSHLKNLKDDVQCNLIDEVRIKVVEMFVDVMTNSEHKIPNLSSNWTAVPLWIVEKRTEPKERCE